MVCPAHNNSYHRTHTLPSLPHHPTRAQSHNWSTDLIPKVPKRTMSSALTSRAQRALVHRATKRPDRERDSSRCTVASTESGESYRWRTTTGGTLSPRCSSRSPRGFTRRADCNQSGQIAYAKDGYFPSIPGWNGISPTVARH